MAKQTIELEVPDGWELTGEFRRAMNSEAILDNTPLRAVHVGQPMGTEGPRLILRKIEPEKFKRKVWLAHWRDGAMSIFCHKPGHYSAKTCIAITGPHEIEFVDGEGLALEPAEGEG